MTTNDDDEVNINSNNDNFHRHHRKIKIIKEYKENAASKERKVKIVRNNQQKWENDADHQASLLVEMTP